MELGADALLTNAAIAEAHDAAKMTEAMKLAIAEGSSTHQVGWRNAFTPALRVLLAGSCDNRRFTASADSRTSPKIQVSLASDSDEVPGHWFVDVAVLRGFGEPVAKSALLLSVSVQPPLFLRTLVVLDGAAVADVSEQVVPVP